MKKVDIYEVVRHNIKKYRLSTGMTQAQLAEKTGLTHDYIRQVESDKVANTFSLQTIYDISLALGVDIRLLFNIENED